MATKNLDARRDAFEETPPHDPDRATRPGRSWARTVVVFLAVLLVIEVGLRIAEPQLPKPLSWPTEKMQEKYEQMSAMADAGETADIAFVGSSTVFDGINPLLVSEELSGVTTYNAGITGAISPRTWRWWTNEVVLPRLQPDTVVVGVGTVDLNSAIPDGFWQLVTGSPAYDQVQGNLSSEVEQTATEWSALFRLRTVLREPVRLLLLFGQDSDEVLVGPQGIDLRTEEPEPYRITEEQGLRIQWEQLRGYDVPGDDLAELEGLVSDLLEGGHEVILVNMPVTDDLVRLLPEGESDYAGYLAALQDLAREHDIGFLDYGRVFDSVGPFKDPSHLNHQGADLFSERLAADLDRLRR